MSGDDFLYLLGILAFLHVVIAIPVTLQVMAFGNKNLKLTATDTLFDDEEVMAWAQQHGFVPLGEFSLSAMQNATIVAWQQQGKMEYFCVYLVANRVVFDFVTCFDNLVGLTTGNTRDGILLPSTPRSYHQCFEKLSLGEQYRCHQDAARFIMERAKTNVAAARETFPKIFVAAIQKQMAYIRTLFLWPLRGFWWFFWRRNRFVNKSIAEQVERHWVTAPENLL